MNDPIGAMLISALFPQDHVAPRTQFQNTGMSPRQEAALNELALGNNTAAAALARMYEITLQEAQEVVDFFNAWCE